MIRFLLLISLLVNLTYASGKKYFIQFGSFKDLRGLERHIEKLPSSLRTHVVIVRSNSWYIPFAYYTSNKNSLRSKLASYKRYFRDARIAYSSSMLKYPLVRNYGKRRGAAPKREYIPPVRTYTQPAPIEYVSPIQQRAVPQYQNVGISENEYIVETVEPIISTQKVVVNQAKSNDVFSTDKPKKYKTFSKQMLSGQDYYLAYKKTDANPSLLIKVIFENHEVTYQPIVGEMQMTKASYLVEDGKLYMFTDSFTKNGSFSTLEKHYANYFLVSSWANGKKLNSLRYYYKLNDAKKYLGLRTSSDPLAEILSEGDYDDSFFEE